MPWKMVLTYLHFRILKISYWYWSHVVGSAVPHDSVPMIVGQWRTSTPQSIHSHLLLVYTVCIYIYAIYYLYGYIYICVCVCVIIHVHIPLKRQPSKIVGYIAILIPWSPIHSWFWTTNIHIYASWYSPFFVGYSYALRSYSNLASTAALRSMAALWSAPPRTMPWRRWQR